MSCALTQGLNLDCRDSTGGLKTVKIMELDNALTITEALGIVTAIVKAATKKFFSYKLVLNTGDVEDALTTNRENGTIMAKQTLKFPINKMSASVRNELLLLAQNRLIIVVEDNNGYKQVFGKENGLTLITATGKSGQKYGDRNGYELVFEGEEKTLAPSMSDVCYLTLETPGV